jgi:hypothetical protein
MPSSPSAALTSASVLTWSLLVIMHATVGSAASNSSSHSPVHANVKAENDHLVNVICETRVWTLLDTLVTVPFLAAPVKASRSPMLQGFTPASGTLEARLSSSLSKAPGLCPPPLRSPAWLPRTNYACFPVFLPSCQKHCRRRTRFVHVNTHCADTLTFPFLSSSSRSIRAETNPRMRRAGVRF